MPPGGTAYTVVVRSVAGEPTTKTAEKRRCPSQQLAERGTWCPSLLAGVALELIHWVHWDHVGSCRFRVHYESSRCLAS